MLECVDLIEPHSSIWLQPEFRRTFRMFGISSQWAYYYLVYGVLNPGIPRNERRKALTLTGCYLTNLLGQKSKHKHCPKTSDSVTINMSLFIPESVFERRWAIMLYHPPPEKGQGLMEYALILVLLAVVVAATLMAFGPFLGNLYSKIYNLWPK